MKQLTELALFICIIYVISAFALSRHSSEQQQKNSHCETVQQLQTALILLTARTKIIQILHLWQYVVSCCFNYLKA